MKLQLVRKKLQKAILIFVKNFIGLGFSTLTLSLLTPSYTSLYLWIRHGSWKYRLSSLLLSQLHLSRLKDPKLQCWSSKQNPRGQKTKAKSPTFHMEVLVFNLVHFDAILNQLPHQVSIFQVPVARNISLSRCDNLYFDSPLGSVNQLGF